MGKKKNKWNPLSWMSSRQNENVVQESPSRTDESQFHGIALDLSYYRKRYSDLAGMSDSELKTHWKIHGYGEGRFASAEHAASQARNPDDTSAGGVKLDFSYYRKRYPDLQQFTDTQLQKHWNAYGYREGRFASAAHAASQAAKDSASALNRAAASRASGATTPPEKLVDSEFYLTLYPDLPAHGIATQAQADAHYRRYGEAEGRAASMEAWAKQHKLPLELIPENFSLKKVIRRNARRGIELEPRDILDTFLGHCAAPVALADSSTRTLACYMKLGRYYLAGGKRDKGRALLKAGLSFASSAEALELLGNAYLDDDDAASALNYYQTAQNYPNPPKWIYYNLARCFARAHRYSDAMRAIANGFAVRPGFSQQLEELDRLAEQWWSYVQAGITAAQDAGVERSELVEQVRCFAVTLYRVYLMACQPAAAREHQLTETWEDGVGTALPSLPQLGSINGNRILIVGDFYLPQCKHYRIDQKVEQLRVVGKEVTAIDWTELEQHPNTLAFHDVVIFYRVPAVPKVIKAIAQVNASGKLSLYEIDDLVFESEYPLPIESYGGYVSLDGYQALERGMALFNAAARLCRHGIASTEPLREKLAPLVQEGRCWLHRNGLDHLNEFRRVDKSHKKTIDIFYGSGTKAHNSDFVELALPAIERVLEEVPEARLVVVGYLKLPEVFRTRFADQFAQMPVVKSLQGYWSLLEQADINIAVLQDDTINACKSELKWFEAACFGIPSVVSSTANYRDVIKDGTDAFLATSVTEWYDALKQLANDTGLRRRVGQAAMQRVRDAYSLEALGTQLVTQLEQAAESAARSKRKVALVNVYFPPQSIGGATRVVADNFSMLRKQYGDEFEVCVFTADAEHRAAHRMTVYDYRGTRVYRATIAWRKHMDWHPEDPEMYRLFAEFLELEKPDIIHFHCVQRLTASVVEAARDAGIPYIVTAHDAWWISDFQFLVDHNGKVYPDGHPDPYEVVDLPRGITLAESIERRRNLKDLLHGARQVLTVSNSFAEIYRKNGISEIEVVPNGISDDLPWAPKQTAYSEKVVCGHFGGMTKHKGYHLLKEAVLAAQPEHLEFLVVDNSREEGYESHTYWGDVPVTFIGRVAQDKVVDLYRKIDVLMAPSTWPESFGLVTREAAACGCWIVASNLGGMGEDVVEDETGHVIAPTEDALKCQITRIDEQPSRYKDAVVCHQHVTAEAQMAQLAKTYQSILHD